MPPTSLKFLGGYREVKDDKGNLIEKRPKRWIEGVPARDLDEADIAKIPADTLKAMTGGKNPLYGETKAPPRGQNSESDASATKKETR